MNKTDIYYSDFHSLSKQEANKIIPFLKTDIIHEKMYDRENSATHLQNFLKMATLEQLQSEKDFFIENKDNTLFLINLFYLANNNYMSGPLKLDEKLKLFLSWGYNKNVTLGQLGDEIKNYVNMDKFDIGATMLHTASRKSVLRVLLNSGIDTTMKTQLYPTLRKLSVDSGIKRIDTIDDMIKLYSYLNSKEIKKEENSVIDSYKYNLKWILFQNSKGFIFNDKSEKEKNQIQEVLLKNWMIQEYNKSVEDGVNFYSAYDLAMYENQKTKILLLKPYENTQSVYEDEKKQLDKILLSKGVEKNKLLSDAIRKDNQCVLNSLGLLDLQSVNRGRKNILHSIVRLGALNWAEKIVNNNLMDSEVEDEQVSYLEYACSTNKSKLFILFYKKGWTQNLDSVVSTLNKNIEHYKTIGLDDDHILSCLPTTIIKFLADNGHYFNNTVLLEKIAKYEKEKLMIDLSSDKKETKKSSFKL